MNNFDKNPIKIEKMFDEISFKYDFLNNIISFFTHLSIKTKAINLLEISSDSKILDLCCGSGDLGRIIKNKFPKTDIVGVDFSSNMLEIAKKKNKKIKYHKMNALKMDFKDESFDFVVMGFGLRNIQQSNFALKEIYRVLKRGGYFLHLDFGKKNIISLIYDKIILFFINFFKNKEAYLYLINSKNNFKEPNELVKEFCENGFEVVLVKYFLFENISAQIMKKI